MAIVLRFVDRSWSQSIIGNVEEWGGVLRRFQPFFSGKNLRLYTKFLYTRNQVSLPENFKFQEKKEALLLSSLRLFFPLFFPLFFIIIIRLLLLVLLYYYYYHVNDDD